jgi:hypothetical protein
LKKEYIDLTLYSFVAALGLYLMVDLAIENFKNRKKKL